MSLGGYLPFVKCERDAQLRYLFLGKSGALVEIVSLLGGKTYRLPERDTSQICHPLRRLCVDDGLQSD